MKKILYVAALGAALSVTACQEVRIESNLNPQNFVDYAKPATVEEYTDQSILDHRYHSIGMIAGLACQEKEDDFIARESEARTDAKIQIADLGGNGVVFGKCVRLEKTKACHVSVTCYAEGFIIDDSYKDPKLKAEQERLAAEAQAEKEARAAATAEAIKPENLEAPEQMSREDVAKLSVDERVDRAARIALKAEAESQAAAEEDQK